LGVITLTAVLPLLYVREIRRYTFHELPEARLIVTLGIGIITTDPSAA
jgi:hypothetical protein